MELAAMNFINYDPASINQLNRKRLKTEFKKLIEDNNIDKLEYLLSNDFNLKLLKREKYLDPYVVAIKSNNLGIFDYLSKKGFKIKGILARNKLSYSSKKRKLDELNPIERPLKKSSSIDLNRYNSDSSAESECNEPQSSSSSSLLDDDQNAKSSLPNYSYSNALIEAIKCLNYDATKLLINLNVNVNSSNYKYVPLQIAYNIYSKERDKFLLNQKYDQYRLEVSIFYYYIFV